MHTFWPAAVLKKTTGNYSTVDIQVPWKQILRHSSLSSLKKGETQTHFLSLSRTQRQGSQYTLFIHCKLQTSVSFFFSYWQAHLKEAKQKILFAG